MTARPVVAVFCMPERGHFQRLRSIISGLGLAGASTHVFTHGDFRPQVEAAGGTFVDLFARYPLEQADAESIPFVCRYVSFAGHFAEDVRRDVAALRPALVVHDGFAVIGRVVATLLGIPRVNVCAGHNVVPDRFLALLRQDPRVRLSERCHHAVEILRTRHGMADASPFSYVAAPSPDLNLYCEPPAFLDEEERRAFAPLAFWGCLPPVEELQIDERGPGPFGHDADSAFKVYISFGTVVWRYYAAEARRALEALAAAFAQRGGCRVLISLGGHDAHDADTDALAALRATGATVAPYVDQWRVLGEADLFVTHNGLNSTHEAIFCGVPMISYPFFWDQPALAERCQRLGLAVPLTPGLRSPVRLEDVERATSDVTRSRATMGRALAAARRWEEQVMAQRPAVVERILALGR